MLSNQQPDIISRYMIEVEEDEELVGEERDVEVLVVKTEKIPPRPALLIARLTSHMRLVKL